MIETLKQPDIPAGAKVFRLKSFQDKFIFSIKRFPAFVAAWGTGKTMSLIARALNACKDFKGNRGLILRREWVDLRDSTIKDWLDLTKMKLNGDRNAILPNGSEIMFRHGEELTERNLQNMNLGFFIMEQAEEFESDNVFEKLRGRLRKCNGCVRKLVKGELRCVCYQWGGVIANTNGHNWIYNLWKANSGNDYELAEATTFDNEANLPLNFIEDLKRMETDKPKVYRRFVMNSWDEVDAVDVVIDPEWIRSAVGKELQETRPIKRVVSIDVSRYGDDKTVFYAIENGACLGKEIHEKKNTMEIVGRSLLFAERMSCHAFAVDEIGVGAGVVDRLKELGKDVVPVNSSEKSYDPERFYNTRAEVYGYGAMMFQENKVSILPDDGELREQLSWAKYKIIKSNGQIQIESKDDIKKRYGRSPDECDAFLNGLWALQKIQNFIGSDKRKGVVLMHPAYREGMEKLQRQNQSYKRRNPYEGIAIPEAEWAKRQGLVNA